jgi:hypothetical protein
MKSEILNEIRKPCLQNPTSSKVKIYKKGNKGLYKRNSKL